jgi:hypothetical protein
MTMDKNLSHGYVLGEVLFWHIPGVTEEKPISAVPYGCCPHAVTSVSNVAGSRYCGNGTSKE